MNMFFILLLGTVVSLAEGVGCPIGCTCNDETFVVQCERTKLDVLPITLNPAIQRLVLHNNKIKSIDAAFQFYRDLQYVDLSNNHLRIIPSKCFMYQEKLQELHLSKNKLSSITNATFQGLRSLTVLNLRENYLEELPRGLFNNLSKLEELNLGQNRISKIDSAAFDNLTSLRVLYLDDNLLSVVPTLAFALLGSLAELHVGINNFKNLRDDAFKGLNKLSVLDLNGAGLLNITTYAFRGLTGLRTLNLEHNRLSRVPTEQLSILVRLEELYVGQNEFEQLDANAFKGLSNLRKIDITGAARLKLVAKGAFNENLNIETIILASNRELETIEDEAMVGLPYLKHLVLKENAFKTFSQLLLPWNELKSLEVSDNPLNCDCKLLWMANLLSARNMTSAQCASPLPLRGKQLKLLGADDLGCSFSDPRQQAILLTLGVSAVIVIGGLALFLFRYRQRVREALKDYKWNKRAISRKEHEYQKTFSSDDDYYMRTGQQHQQQHNNLHHHHPSNIIKPIPVTEL